MPHVKEGEYPFWNFFPEFKFFMKPSDKKII